MPPQDTLQSASTSIHHSDVILMMSYGDVIACWLMSLVGVDGVIVASYPGQVGGGRSVY